MAEGKAKRKLVTPEAQGQPELTLIERITQLGIPPAEMTEDVSVTISALLERIEDVTRELDTAREEFMELERLVDVDTLAPVPNRRAFMRRLDWAISMFKRYGHSCSIIYFDLNGFKAINDEYSHAAGDEVIRTVAQVLTDSLRTSDFMARLGGDEFVVLLYYAKEEAARQRASVIARRIASHSYLWKGYSLSVSASVGTYEIKPGDSAESALAHADEAMYQHKKSNCP